MRQSFRLCSVLFPRALIDFNFSNCSDLAAGLSRIQVEEQEAGLLGDLSLFFSCRCCIKKSVFFFPMRSLPET